MSSFDGWDGSDGSKAFTMPGDDRNPMGRGREQAEPPAQVEDLPAAVPEISGEMSPEKAALDEALGLIRGLAQQEQSVALSEAKALYEDGELSGHEIVEMLNRGAGPEIASQFFDYWQADVQGEPEPLTPDQWLDTINRKVADVQRANEEAAQAESAQAQAEQDAAVNARFTESVHAARQKIGVKWTPDLQSYLNGMGANLSPSLEEAPAVAEKLVRQFAALERAEYEAEIKARFNASEREAVAAGFWNKPDHVPATAEDAYARDYLIAIKPFADDPTLTNARPTRTAQVLSDADNWNAESKLVIKNWNL